MKSKAIIVVIAIVIVLPIASYAQKKDFFLKPRALSFYANANGMWEIKEGVSGQWMDFLRLRAQVLLGYNLSVIVENRTRIYQDDKTQNDWPQYYLQYSNAISHKRKFPLFRYPSLLTIKGGKQEWYPTYRNFRLIAENIDQFRDPTSFYGFSGDLIMPLIKNRNLIIRISGHSGDLINNKVDPELLNLYLSLRQPLYKKFGISARAGHMQGSQHAVNYAYAYYKPQIEQMILGFKAGKLLSLDQIPYGVEISIERKFKYFAIGGYYQRRINQSIYLTDQNGQGQIFGFSIRIIGPPKLKKIFDTYQFMYDSNTETIRFLIPFFTTDVFFK